MCVQASHPAEAAMESSVYYSPPRDLDRDISERPEGPRDCDQVGAGPLRAPGPRAADRGRQAGRWCGGIEVLACYCCYCCGGDDAGAARASSLAQPHPRQTVV